MIRNFGCIAGLYIFSFVPAHAADAKKQITWAG